MSGSTYKSIHKRVPGYADSHSWAFVYLKDLGQYLTSKDIGQMPSQLYSRLTDKRKPVGTFQIVFVWLVSIYRVLVQAGFNLTMELSLGIQAYVTTHSW